MKEKRSKIREKLSLRAVGLILAMSMVAGTLLPVGVGAEELPIDINNEEITVADVMMYEDTDMSEDEEENEAAAENEEVIDVVSEENSEEAPAETSEPEAAEPETTESEVSESEVSEPEVTEPVETEPETTEPEVTEPEVPDFEETEPDEIITEEELPADAPEEEIYFCGIEEHEHTEECRNAPKEPDGEIIVEEELPEEEPQPEEELRELYCGYEVHVHDDTCWNEEYLADCGMEEHEHSENCYSLAYTLMAEFATAVELFPDEADYILLDFDEADGSELLDEEAYYRAYAAFYEENPDIWMTTDALYNEASEAFDAENHEGDFDAWMQDNGFWEAVEKFYGVVPMPEDVEAMIAQYEEAEEIELEFTAEEEAPVLYADGKAEVVSNNVTLDATVKVFNYDNTVNTRTDGLGPEGYSFFQGDYVKNDGDADTKEGSVDGVYGGNADVYNKNNKPVLNSKLVDGYPYVDSKAEGSTVEIEGSMAYLFNAPYLKGTMTDGGGLFQKDAKGYYYYDSMKNAASYKDGKFILYDTVIRPKYTAATGTDVQRSNFLPFNNAEQSTVDTNLSENAGKVPAAYLNDPVDLWFGMTVEFDFFMPKDGKMNDEDMIFDFHGDDDVFVYIDDVLVVNLIGTHAAETATINFNTGDVVHDKTGTDNDTSKKLKEYFNEAGEQDTEFNNNTFADYTRHTLKFFYMERGGNISYCRLRFNMPILPAESLTVGKELEIDDNTANQNIGEHLQETLSYKFRILKEDDKTNLFEDDKDKSFTVYADTNCTIEKRSGELDANGYFELKAGEYARFTDMFNKKNDGNGNGINYIVEELIPVELFEQYDGVAELGTAVKIRDESTGEEYMSYKTGVLNTKKSEFFVFRNLVDINELSALQITKLKSDGSTGITDDQKFEMYVELGDSPLPVGTVYMIKGDNNTYNVEEAGIIPLKVGQTAIITGILSGTKYEVYEVDGEEYYVTYDATVECTTHAPEGQKTCEDCAECCPSITPSVAKSEDVEGDHGLVSGELSLNSSVEITATNSTYDVKESLDLYVLKQVTGNMGDQSKAFDFTVTIEEDTGTIAEEPAMLLFSMGTAEQVGSEDIGSADGNTDVFELAHDQKYHITGIPKDYKITVTESESASGYSTVIEYYVPDVNAADGYRQVIIDVDEYGQEHDGVRTVTIPAVEIVSGGYIIFTNDKTATIDTAVHLDYLPYILILTAVIPTMTLAVSRKRRRRED